jgi:hypothetical protein
VILLRNRIYVIIVSIPSEVSSGNGLNINRNYYFMNQISKVVSGVQVWGEILNVNDNEGEKMASVTIKAYAIIQIFLRIRG